MHFLHIALFGQLSLRKNIANVPRYNRLISLEKLHHLRLGQPDCVLLQADIQTNLTIRGFVEYNLAATIDRALTPSHTGLPHGATSLPSFTFSHAFLYFSTTNNP